MHGTEGHLYKKLFVVDEIKYVNINDDQCEMA